jgi:hypothetical protein
MRAYVVDSVRIPPTAEPKMPPRGAPAENVAYAQLRARPGGK